MSKEATVEPAQKMPAAKAPTLSDELAARLTPEERAEASRTLWRERLYSLWSPITIFGAIFAVYIVIVELHTEAWHVGQPVMQGIGLLAVLAFVVLLILRTFVRPFGALRTARHEARETISEAQSAYGSKTLSPQLKERTVELALAIERRYVGTDPQALSEATLALSRFVEKDLGRKRYGTDFIWGFVKALAIALLIRTIIIEPFKIPSGSMIPTLAIGDQIFVNKFIYGVRIPFVNIVPFKIIRSPQRGDVIVFNNPLEPDRDFIKRVIAVPGDTVVLQKDVLTINGVRMDRKVVDDNFRFMDQAENGLWIPRSAQKYEENLDGHLHPTLQIPETSCQRDFNEGKPFTVPPESVFVMGDNRDNSSDSRFGLGTSGPCQDKLAYVPFGNIKGKAMVIWLSLSHDGFLHQLFGGTGLRTDRLFLPVR